MTRRNTHKVGNRIQHIKARLNNKRIMNGEGVKKAWQVCKM